MEGVGEDWAAIFENEVYVDVRGVGCGRGLGGIEKEAERGN